MLGIKRIVIGDGERGLLYANRRLKRVLTPGVYYLADLFGRMEVRTHGIAEPMYAGDNAEVIIESLSAGGGRAGKGLEEHFVLADIGDNEAGLVYAYDKLTDVLAPNSRRLYWRGPAQVRIERLALTGDRALSDELVRKLRRLPMIKVYGLWVEARVPDESVGLLFVEGKLDRVLEPGVYGFWDFDGAVDVQVVDRRVQAVEVTGQELLTRDKVSLRANLSASYRITDPVAAHTRVKRLNETLYRELQFGLRKAVSAKTLDELLGDKATLDADIAGYAKGRVSGLGVELLGVGVKDLILPGDMKAILNGVVEAEKAAQADVIRRRQEANAARSLANTAKLMASNPTLMRLKELEALEQVTAKVDHLTVFGGLDGVMSQLVKLREA